jgi:hypothetical protein
MCVVLQHRSCLRETLAALPLKIPLGFALSSTLASHVRALTGSLRANVVLGLASSQLAAPDVVAPTNHAHRVAGCTTIQGSDPRYPLKTPRQCSLRRLHRDNFIEINPARIECRQPDHGWIVAVGICCLL